MKRLIFHVDVNSAFLSWEAAYRLYHQGARVDLREIPSVVGGDQEKRHGIILAKSLPTKKYKIHTGESVAAAKNKCPHLVVVPPNYELYTHSSEALVKLLTEYTDKIERYSIDELFLDMTGYAEDPLKTACEIRDRVLGELGFTVNVGVSSNKLLAKMASDFEKPNKVHTLWKEEVPEKMWPLPVEDLFYVGRATRRKMEKYGIHTIGELAHTDIDFLRSVMKSHGALIWQYANGIDESAVISEAPPNKGYGNSLTTPRDVTEAQLAKQYLLSLAETVSARLRADGARISTVAVSIRDWDLCFFGHQVTLAAPTDLTREIYNAACRCFDEMWDGRPLRHLGIHTSNVSREEFRQINLFEPIDYEKQKKAELAVDSLRQRYGEDCVMRACFLPSASDPGRAEIDHMGGGISRDRRRVDYSKETIL